MPPSEPGLAAEAESRDQREVDEEDDSAASGGPAEQLSAIVESAKTARVTPADEARAVELLKQTIPGGPKLLPATLDALLTLPWSAAVKAVAESWPATKAAGRARLIGGLARADSDVSRRIRLSLARGLHAQDPASALKILVSVCEAMGGAQGGSSSRDRQTFANVMLGKARPWIMNIAMAEMKPAEAQKIITPALESCGQAPVFTQIWVLRWIIDAGKFDTLPPEHVEAIAKSINRWQARWKKELRKNVPTLPEALIPLLTDLPAAGDEPQAREAKPRGAKPRPAAQAEEESGDQDEDEEEELEDEEDEEDEDQEREEDDGEDEEEDEPGDKKEGEDLRSAEDYLESIIVGGEPRRPAARPASEPAQQSRGQAQQRGGRGQQQQPFDFNRAMRDVEGYVARLRTELQQAQAAARRREGGGNERRGRGGGGQQPASAEELDELRRHNIQLEEQNQELRQRIEELTGDHEDRAATLGIDDSLQQFKTYLALRLKEDYADYVAIGRESFNDVVRRHAHEILGRVFGLLGSEGVQLEPPK